MELLVLVIYGLLPKVKKPFDKLRVTGISIYY